MTRISESTSKPTFEQFPSDVSDLPGKIRDAYERSEIKEALRQIYETNYDRAIELLDTLSDCQDEVVQGVRNLLLKVCERLNYTHQVYRS